jgi:hypothetical protein
MRTFQVKFVKDEESPRPTLRTPMRSTAGAGDWTAPEAFRAPIPLRVAHPRQRLKAAIDALRSAPAATSKSPLLPSDFPLCLVRIKYTYRAPVVKELCSTKTFKRLSIDPSGGFIHPGQA